MFELDASGLSCPEPVILLKKAVREYDEVRLTVDNRASAEICRRYAAANGFAVDVTGGGGVYTLVIRRIEGDRSGR